MSSLYSSNKHLPCTRKSLSESLPSLISPNCKSYWHNTASRSESATEESVASRTLGNTSSCATQWENRLSAASKGEHVPDSKDYKKMYENALAENKSMKSSLEGRRQELVRIQMQLKVTQKQDRIPEKSSMLGTQEQCVLEKKISEMEKEYKELTELKSENRRLKDENGALIRVIGKLSN